MRDRPDTRETREWRRADNNASKTGKFPSERLTAATRSLKYGRLCSDVLFLPFFQETQNSNRVASIIRNVTFEWDSFHLVVSIFIGRRRS